MNKKQAVSEITKELINSLPTEHFNKMIVIVDNPREMPNAIEHLAKADILGFDTESKPSFKKGVVNKISLIQLSTEERCYLFQLNKLGFDHQLGSILSNEKILKIGFSIKNDFDSLKSISFGNFKNFLDLQVLADEYGYGTMSLQKIYALFFQKKLSKRNRLSNWGAEILTQSQQEYAALDAWACLQIYKHIINVNHHAE